MTVGSGRAGWSTVHNWGVDVGAVHIEGYHEVLALHKALMECKFDDLESIYAGSPFIAAIQHRPPILVRGGRHGALRHTTRIASTPSAGTLPPTSGGTRPTTGNDERTCNISSHLYGPPKTCSTSWPASHRRPRRTTIQKTNRLLPAQIDSGTNTRR